MWDACNLVDRFRSLRTHTSRTSQAQASSSKNHLAAPLASSIKAERGREGEGERKYERFLNCSLAPERENQRHTRTRRREISLCPFLSLLSSALFSFPWLSSAKKNETSFYFGNVYYLLTSARGANFLTNTKDTQISGTSSPGV